MTSGLLVDTHILLWSRFEPERLTAGERATIVRAGIRYISIATLWEFGILMRLRRITNDLRVMEVPAGYRLLPVHPNHCKTFAGLPLHHRDPFDRMLIAQAATERVALLTRDHAMLAYGDYATILRLPEA